MTARALELLQSWLAVQGLSDSRLVLVSERAVGVAVGESPELSLAALPGLVRSAHSEHPDRFGLIDGDGGQLPWPALAAALREGESELAVREQTVLVPRVSRLGRTDDALVPGPDDQGWRLGVSEPGTLDSLALLPSPSAGVPLGEGQVRVAVHAAGVNFRDVAVALGLCRGRIRRLGLRVRGWWLRLVRGLRIWWSVIG